MTDNITPSDLLQILLASSGSLAAYWNILIAGIAAIIGVLASGKSFVSVPTTRVLLSGLFIVFAMSNLVAILDLVDQRRVIVELLPKSGDFLELARAFTPPGPLVLILFHLVIQVW